MINRIAPFAIALLAATVLAAPGLAKPSAKGAYAAALADPARPATERARDAARLPGELLTFAQIARGEKVGDFIMGGGYLTRILARSEEHTSELQSR